MFDTMHWSLLDKALNRTGIIRQILDYYIYYVNVVSLIAMDGQDFIIDLISISIFSRVQLILMFFHHVKIALGLE